MAHSAMSSGKHGNVLPLWGNEKTMNLNPMILTNVLSSPYFKVQLYELKTYHEVVDEIYFKVTHVEPWEKGSRKTAGQTGMCGGVRGVGTGGIVSTAFCLLYKLFTLKLTRKQVMGLITHTDSPYIRALGFMYIRYTQPPSDLVDWYDDFLDDDEELDVKAGGGCVMTIGEMLRSFLTKLEWFCTLFPRIPVPVQKMIDQQMKARPQVAPQKDEHEEEAVSEPGRQGECRRSRSPHSSPHRSRSRSHHREWRCPSFDRELERERDRQRKEREGKDRDWGERDRGDRDRQRDRERGERGDHEQRHSHSAERHGKRSSSQEHRKEKERERERDAENERSGRKERDHRHERDRDKVKDRERERSKDKRGKGGSGEERRHREDREDNKTSRHREEKKSKHSSRSRSKEGRHKSHSHSSGRHEQQDERDWEQERGWKKEGSQSQDQDGDRGHKHRRSPDARKRSRRSQSPDRRHESP